MFHKNLKKMKSNKTASNCNNYYYIMLKMFYSIDQIARYGSGIRVVLTS